jgi:hypothetical protein
MHWDPSLLEMRPKWSDSPEDAAPGDIHCGSVGGGPCGYSNGDITRVEFEGDPPSEVAHTYRMTWNLVIQSRHASLSASIRWNTLVGSGPTQVRCQRCSLTVATYTADFSVCDDINAGITLYKLYEIPALPTFFDELPGVWCQLAFSGTDSIDFPETINVVGLP